MTDFNIQENMDFKKYAQLSAETKVFDLHTDKPIEYCLIALIGEVGELSNKYKKVLRGDYSLESIQVDLASELGDVLWYLNQLAEYLGTDLETVAVLNIAKLLARKQEGTIQGDGDHR